MEVPVEAEDFDAIAKLKPHGVIDSRDPEWNDVVRFTSRCKRHWPKATVVIRLTATASFLPVQLHPIHGSDTTINRPCIIDSVCLPGLAAVG